jgi:hypothetical protein
LTGAFGTKSRADTGAQAIKFSAPAPIPFRAAIQKRHSISLSRIRGKTALFRAAYLRLFESKRQDSVLCRPCPAGERLRAYRGVSIIAKNLRETPSRTAIRAGDILMANFEDMGRALDRELEKLRAVAEEKLSPGTCDKAARVLRSVSASLSRLAEQFESKSAGKKSS